MRAPPQARRSDAVVTILLWLVRGVVMCTYVRNCSPKREEAIKKL
jgi:hypothetical protein